MRFYCTGVEWGCSIAPSENQETELTEVVPTELLPRCKKVQAQLRALEGPSRRPAPVTTPERYLVWHTGHTTLSSGAHPQNRHRGDAAG